MQLTEHHVISKCDPLYDIIDAAAFASKNLYHNEERTPPADE